MKGFLREQKAHLATAFGSINRLFKWGINVQTVKKFKPEYITIILMVIVSFVLLLTLFTGLASLKESISYSLVIILLCFLTIDIKKNSFKEQSSNIAFRYVLMIFLFAYLALF